MKISSKYFLQTKKKQPNRILLFIIQESDKTTIDEIFFVNQSLDEKLHGLLRDKQQQLQEIQQLKSDLIEEKTRWKSLQEQHIDLTLPSDQTVDQQSKRDL